MKVQLFDRRVIPPQHYSLLRMPPLVHAQGPQPKACTASRVQVGTLLETFPDPATLRVAVMCLITFCKMVAMNICEQMPMVPYVPFFFKEPCWTSSITACDLGEFFLVPRTLTS
jgi:hypothetical protein